MALLIGGQDPLQFLAAHPHDWPIQVAVLNEAIKLDNDRRKGEQRSLIEGIGTSTGNRVAELFSRMRF